MPNSPYNTPHTYKRGLTLIEVLVVISIVSIFPLIVISNFPQARLQFSLSRAAHAFAQDMRKAQDMALSATPYNDAFGVPQPISGYGIYLDPSGVLGNKRYIIYADKKPGNQQYDALDYIVTNYDLGSSEPGIIIKEIQHVSGITASINFNPPKPDTVITSLANGQNAVIIVFALESDVSRTRSVYINTSGLIEVR